MDAHDQTPDELRRQAAGHDQAAQDSFERCDTDGFVSQWAHGLSAGELRAKARLAEQGGMTETRVLCDLEGRVISTHEFHGQYGWGWVLTDEAAARFGRRFLSTSEASTAKRARANDHKKGVSVGLARVRGYVTIAGSGTGLAGAATCRVVERPVVEELKAGNYELLTTDHYPERSADIDISDIA